MALLVLYWAGWETYFKSDLLCQTVWGGLLGKRSKNKIENMKIYVKNVRTLEQAFISGVAALVALKTDTPNFPIFMLCHVTFAALAPMMCLLARVISYKPFSFQIVMLVSAFLRLLSQKST